MRMRAVAVLAGMLGMGCASRLPQVVVGGAGPGDLRAFLAAHVPAPEQAIRVDEIGRTASASYHVVQVQGAERPHLHATHDLTVVVLEGRGTLRRLGTAPLALDAGDAVVIPRGQVHWFIREGGTPAVALVAFAPPLEAPDNVPAPEVSAEPGR
jgi:quercetin dioxygenase-like cupin family protein